MLHAKRVRLAEMAEREAAGEIFWSTVFDQPFRVKILHLADRLSGGWEDYYRDAREQIMNSEGLLALYSTIYGPQEDFRQYILNCTDEMMPTVIEAWLKAARNPRLNQNSSVRGAGVTFESTVKALLNEHRISFDIVDDEMIPLDSLELHASVVEPVLRLITSPGVWNSAEQPYLKALSEISSNNADDAITDAGTALQAVLTTLGCTGNALGPLIKSARQKGLLGAHDNPMLEGIDKILNWVSAERSTNGDGHKTSSATLEDAWLIVHIVGAIIVRLSKNTARG